jgi:hypothetical protein
MADGRAWHRDLRSHTHEPAKGTGPVRRASHITSLADRVSLTSHWTSSKNTLRNMPSEFPFGSFSSLRGRNSLPDPFRYSPDAVDGACDPDQTDTVVELTPGEKEKMVHTGAGRKGMKAGQIHEQPLRIPASVPGASQAGLARRHKHVVLKSQALDALDDRASHKFYLGPLSLCSSISR